MHTLFFPLAGVMYALQESNTAGKVIVVVLFAGSIVVWSIMVTKFRELRQAGRASMRFLAEYRKQSHPLHLFLKRQTFDGAPVYRVYDRTCGALGLAFEARGADPAKAFVGGGAGAGDARLLPAHLESVREAAERTAVEQALALESHMGLLATSTTTAPFLGLLGTVWGVMDSFGGMAVTGSAMLSAVAPGISGALLTTVIGLLVALPSAIGYNLLSDRIRQLTVQMDNFAQELTGDMGRRYL